MFRELISCSGCCYCIVVVVDVWRARDEFVVSCMPERVVMSDLMWLMDFPGTYLLQYCGTATVHKLPEKTFVILFLLAGGPGVEDQSKYYILSVRFTYIC